MDDRPLPVRLGPRFEDGVDLGPRPPLEVEVGPSTGVPLASEVEDDDRPPPLEIEEADDVFNQDYFNWDDDSDDEVSDTDLEAETYHRCMVNGVGELFYGDAEVPAPQRPVSAHADAYFMSTKAVQKNADAVEMVIDLDDAQ